MSSRFDVGLAGTCLLEEVYDSFDTLLGELLVALCGTGLLVCITVNLELGFCLDSICEVLEVSLFTSAEGSGTTVEVQSGLGTGCTVNSNELAFLVNVVLTACELVAEILVVLLQGSNLVLEGCILFLEFSNLAGEILILLCSERNRNNSGNNACAALEALLSKLVSYTPSCGEREGEHVTQFCTEFLDACIVSRISVAPGEVIVLGGKSPEVNDHVKIFVSKECVLLGDGTKTKSITKATTSIVGNTGSRISDIAPVTGFLITVNQRTEVKEDIQTKVVLKILEILHGETVIVHTETILRGEPFTDIEIKAKTGLCKPPNLTCVTGVETLVKADATSNKQVVTKGIGLVRSANDVAVCVTVCILLSESAH